MANDNIVQFISDRRILDEHKKNKVFDRLKQYIGEYVTINSIWCGCREIHTEKLKNVDSEYVYIEGLAIPFVGVDSAIVNILSEKKESIYSNTFVEGKYSCGVPSSQDVKEVKKYTYGNRKAELDEQKMKKIEKLRNKTIREDLEKYKLKKYTLMKDGIDLVKPELLEEWFEFVHTNTENGYGQFVEIIISIMKKNEELTDYRQIESDVFCGMSGCAIDLIRMFVIRYYKNGENYKKYLTELDKESKKIYYFKEN